MTLTALCRTHVLCGTYQTVEEMLEEDEQQCLLPQRWPTPLQQQGQNAIKQSRKVRRRLLEYLVINKHLPCRE